MKKNLKIYFSDGGKPNVLVKHGQPDIVFKNRILFVEPGSQLDVELRQRGYTLIKENDLRWPVIMKLKSYTRQIAAEHGFNEDAQ